ncbi:MAG: YXWGXW repeat-containing protein [Polyangiaceae bacterium]
MTTGSPRSRGMWIGAIIVGALALVGCVDEAPPAAAPTRPAPLEEPASTPPAPGMVWAPGCWHWDGSGYVWLPGHWESPQAHPPAAPQPE